MYENKKIRGFTLIELLVVFSLLAVLSGIGVVSFSSYSQSQQITQTAKNTVNFLDEARFNSLSSVTLNKDINGNTVDCGSGTLAGYSVDVDNVYGLVLSENCSGISPTNPIDVMTLSRNISIDNTSTCRTITFAALSAQVSGAPCTIVITGFGNKKTVTVDAGGNTTIN